MKNYTTTLLTIFCVIPLCHSQISNAIIIDSTTETAGVSMFASADIDNDGDNDLITSFSNADGVIAYYENLSNDVFDSLKVIDSLSFSRGVATGDFNNDGWEDVIGIGGTQHEARIYINDSGTFPNSTQLDINISILVNDLVVADFDQNGSDDIVIIGQHSIDFYRNNGTGSFTKEEILSTSTAPGVLECLDLEKVDLDQDGDQDLICGETEGLVTYINDGNGNFNPNYYSNFNEIGTLVHAMDIDQDGDQDVLMQNNAGDLKWFSNDGNGVLTFEEIITAIPQLEGISSVEYNADGLEDIYATYAHNVVLYPNDTSHNFNIETMVYNDNNLIMGAVNVANLNQHTPKDLIWTGANKTVAYHSNESPLFTPDNNPNSFSIYPNPSSGQIYIPSKGDFETIEIYNSTGQKIKELPYSYESDITELPKGIYFLRVLKANGKYTAIKKVVKIKP